MKRCFLSPLNCLHGKFHSTVIFKAFFFFNLWDYMEIRHASHSKHTETMLLSFLPPSWKMDRVLWLQYLLDFITSSPMNSISLPHAPAFTRNFHKEGTEHSCFLRKVCLLRSCSFANSFPTTCLHIWGWAHTRADQKNIILCSSCISCKYIRRLRV